jgi:hypothetical protein
MFKHRFPSQHFVKIIHIRNIFMTYNGSVAEINLATGARYNWLMIIASQVKLTNLQSIRGHTLKGFTYIFWF